MKIKNLFLFLAVTVLSLACPDIFAETIYMKDGRVINEEITEKTEFYIMTKAGSVYRKYYTEQIERIVEDQEVVTVAQDSPSTVDITKFDDISTIKAQLISDFIDASGVRHNMNLNIDQVIAQASEDQQEELRDVFNVDEIIERMIPLYDKFYSQEELSAIIAFFRSPAGLKYLEATPQIMKESVSVSVEYLKEKVSP